MKMRAEEGGKETTCRLYPSHGPLPFITSLAKNEAPEEEAGHVMFYVISSPDINANKILNLSN